MSKLTLRNQRGTSKQIFAETDISRAVSFTAGKSKAAPLKQENGSPTADITVEEWSPETPNLCAIELKDKAGRSVFKLKTGLRHLEAKGAFISLNGRPFYARGYIRGIRAHEHDNIAGLPERDFHRKNILTAKSLGFNLARWHSTIPPETFLELSDELGIFNQIEFAPQYVFGKNKEKSFSLDLDLIKETVRRLGKHPSVFAFCLGNEIHKSGGSDLVRRAVGIIKENCPDALAVDSCGWGEADRETSDILCQHIAYFFPFGKHLDMFSVTDCFDLDGSVKGHPVREEIKGDGISVRSKRSLNAARPTLAHETFHYISLPDLKSLKKKFSETKAEAPWWIAEIEKLASAKGLSKDWDSLVKASAHFKKTCLKEAMTRLRLSPWISGYEMLQLSDTNHYENPNGLADCFDDAKKDFAPVFEELNRDFILLPDMPDKCLTAGNPFTVNILVSNFAGNVRYADIELSIQEKGQKKALLSKTFPDVYTEKTGVYKVLSLEMRLGGRKPMALELSLKAKSEKKTIFSSSFDFWVFPASAETRKSGGVNVIRAIDQSVIKGLKSGKTYLFIYDKSVPPEKTGLPLVSDHFKPVIWDRGHQLGGVIRKHPVTDKFPHEDLIDFQFYRLIEEGAKANIDALPELTPVIQGIDKAARDRMDGLIFGKKDFIPDYTLRRFAYLFEMSVGKGKLLVSTFNFSPENMRRPEVAFFYNALLSHAASKTFKPAFKLSPEKLAEWSRGSIKNAMKEPVMSIYWDEDKDPVETTLWWEKVGVDITKLK
jgi:hypothetical protein